MPGANETARTRCYFSPHGGCSDAVVSVLASSGHSIELMGRTLTSAPLVAGLLAAHARGVDVRIVLDAAGASEHRQALHDLIRSGIPVYLDARHAAADNQVVLVDGSTLITGSFGFTPADEDENAENVLILHNQPRLLAAYEDNFRTHLAHSERFDGK